MAAAWLKAAVRRNVQFSHRQDCGRDCSWRTGWGRGRGTGVAAVETGQAVSVVTTMGRAVRLTEAMVSDWRQLSDHMARLNCALGPPAQVELEEGQRRN